MRLKPYKNMSPCGGVPAIKLIFSFEIYRVKPAEKKFGPPIDLLRRANMPRRYPRP